MDTLILVLVAAGAVLVVFGARAGGALRTVAKLVLWVLIVACAALAVAAAWGMFALADKGGGTLFFFALLFGFVAVVLWMFVGTLHEQEHFETLDPAGQADYVADKAAALRADLEGKIVKYEAEMDRFWVSSSRRGKLRDEIDHARQMLAWLDRAEARQRAGTGSNPPVA